MSHRLPPLDPEVMSPEQRAVYDAIVGGVRGSISGPFNAWLRSPVMANLAQSLGEYCRYNTILGPRLSEIAILVVARHWQAQFEWYAHAKLAMEAGHTAETVAAIKSGERPDHLAEKELLVYDYASELVGTGQTGNDIHGRAVDALGEQGVVELVGVIGYYMLVSLTLNAFHVPLPEGEPLPFPG